MRVLTFLPKEEQLVCLPVCDWSLSKDKDINVAPSEVEIVQDTRTVKINGRIIGFENVDDFGDHIVNCGIQIHMIPLSGKIKELGTNRIKLVPSVERVMGVEPTYQPWEGRILPINYTRIW